MQMKSGYGRRAVPSWDRLPEEAFQSTFARSGSSIPDSEVHKHTRSQLKLELPIGFSFLSSFHSDPLDFIGFYWVLPSYAKSGCLRGRFFWTLPSFTGFVGRWGGGGGLNERDSDPPMEIELVPSTRYRVVTE